MMRRRLAAAAVVLSALLLPAVAAAQAPPRFAVISGAWKGGPAKDGNADYCVQEAMFSSGHLLIIGRSKAGEVNLALGIPGGALPVGERWRVTVTADGAPPRERTATAANKALLVVGMGFDDEFFNRLKRGRTLTLKSAADNIGFELSGTSKALAELEKCATTLPAARPAQGGAAGQAPAQQADGTPFPETLTAILAAAGLREVQALLFPDVPADQRPADYAWRAGRVLGGVRERQVAEGVKFEDVSDAFAKALRDRCKGEGRVTLNAIEKLPGVALRTGAVDCAGEDGKGAVHVALVSYLSDARLFAVFFHEAVPAHKAEADDIRDRLAEVFRKLAGGESVAPGPEPAPPAPPAAETPPAPPIADAPAPPAAVKVPAPALRTAPPPAKPPVPPAAATQKPAPPAPAPVKTPAAPTTPAPAPAPTP